MLEGRRTRLYELLNKQKKEGRERSASTLPALLSCRSVLLKTDLDSLNIPISSGNPDVLDFGGSGSHFLEGKDGKVEGGREGGSNLDSLLNFSKLKSSCLRTTTRHSPTLTRSLSLPLSLKPIKEFIIYVKQSNHGSVHDENEENGREEAGGGEGELELES